MEWPSIRSTTWSSLLGNRSGDNHRFDDHQLARERPVGNVPSDRGEARGQWKKGRRHAAERYPQGIHCAERVHLSSRGLDAAGDRRPGVDRSFTPRFNPISISGYHIREAGSTALQELAFTLYDGVEYVEWALRRGLAIDDFAPRLSFFFNAHNDFFEEIGKFRAARKVWYRLMTERFGARNPPRTDAVSHADLRRLPDRAAA